MPRRFLADLLRVYLLWTSIGCIVVGLVWVFLIAPPVPTFGIPLWRSPFLPRTAHLGGRTVTVPSAFGVYAKPRELFVVRRFPAGSLSPRLFVITLKLLSDTVTFREHNVPKECREKLSSCITWYPDPADTTFPCKEAPVPETAYTIGTCQSRQNPLHVFYDYQGSDSTIVRNILERTFEPPESPP